MEHRRYTVFSEWEFRVHFNDIYLTKYDACPGDAYPRGDDVLDEKWFSAGVKSTCVENKIYLLRGHSMIIEIEIDNDNNKIIIVRRINLPERALELNDHSLIGNNQLEIIVPITDTWGMNGFYRTVLRNRNDPYEYEDFSDDVLITFVDGVLQIEKIPSEYLEKIHKVLSRINPYSMIDIHQSKVRIDTGIGSNVLIYDMDKDTTIRQNESKPIVHDITQWLKFSD